MTAKLELVREIKLLEPDKPEFKIPGNIDECCGTCQYCVRVFVRGIQQGMQCRRFPPIPMMVPGRVQGSVDVKGMHPPIDESWWCGEWELATEES